MFSGFYLPLLLVLVALIVRAVGFEFRNREDNPVWRKFWTWMIFGGSAVPALLWGVAITNIMEGVPINEKMQYVGGFFNLLNPYALLGGLTFVGLFAFHGSVFLTLRLEGELLERTRKLAYRLWMPAVALVLLFVIGGYFFTDIFTRLGVNPGVAPVGAAAALLAAGWLLRNGRTGWAFGMTGLTIALATLSIFQGLYPRVMISSIDHAYDLTIYNASSTPYTLGVMSWVAIGFVPVVLAYQAWNYWVFRKRVNATSANHI
jgi:cytochrome d ubiquinol oxidase subunit II